MKNVDESSSYLASATRYSGFSEIGYRVKARFRAAQTDGRMDAPNLRYSTANRRAHILFSGSVNGDVHYYEPAWRYLHDYEKDTWYKVEYVVYDALTKFDYWLDDELIDSGCNMRSISTSERGVKVASRGPTEGTWWIDQVIICKYVKPEPNFTSWATENKDAFNVSDVVAEASFGYDYRGNRVSSKWNGTWMFWDYDSRGRLSVETFGVLGEINTVKYAYNNVSNVVALTYPDGYIQSHTYDSLNRLEGLESLANFTYTASNRIENITYGNDAYTCYIYDSLERPSNIVIYDDADCVLMNLTYT